MAQTFKVLGQASLAAATPTDVYTVPAATSAVVSTVTVCNRSVATTFRLSVAVAGAGADNKQYLCYDVPLSANETRTLTLGLTLAATDVIRGYAAAATVTVNIYGSQIT